jgi:hypothetical protein
LAIALTCQPGGAYGLTLTSYGSENALIVAPVTWPKWDVTWRVENPICYDGVNDYLDDSSATALLQGGGIARIERAAARTELTLAAPPSPHALLHPHLAITALVAGAWLGRRTFHAGSFVRNGGVWAILGDRESGKSSALAWLVQHEVVIFADDLLVLDGDTALAGPRILDLRAGAAQHFAVGRDLGVVGTRSRWRVELIDVAAELPLRGWIVLEWSDADVRVAEVPAPDRLMRLVDARGIIIEEPSTAAWLPIIAKPMLTLTRPRDWHHVDAAMTVLLDAIDSLHS